MDDLLRHPQCGASREEYIFEEIIWMSGPDEACFWGTHGDAGLDLLLIRQGQCFGVEVERRDAPKLTPSLRDVP
jgi:hypothetical protein